MSVFFRIPTVSKSKVIYYPRSHLLVAFRSIVQNVKDVCILKDSRFGIPIENKKSIRFLREINEKMLYTYDKCETRCKLYLKYNDPKIS